LLSFSEGRTFRTAVRVSRQPAAAEELQLGLQAYCHRCGNHWGQPLLRWKGLGACSCGAEPVLSGPLWRGPLQAPALLQEALSLEDPQRPLLAPAAQRLLLRLLADDGLPPEASALADLGRQLGGGPPPLAALLGALRQAGWRASASGVQAQQFRSDAPWPELLATAARLQSGGSDG
jgi:tRNA (guanine26-N2/guanine27-N2)-dimethyltransferase